MKHTVEKEEKVCCIDADIAVDVAQHNLLLHIDDILRKVAHHVEEDKHLHGQLQRAIDQEENITTLSHHRNPKQSEFTKERQNTNAINETGNRAQQVANNKPGGNTTNESLHHAVTV